MFWSCHKQGKKTNKKSFSLPSPSCSVRWTLKGKDEIENQTKVSLTRICDNFYNDKDSVPVDGSTPCLCIFSWYERYLVSLTIFRHLSNTHAQGMSLVNPSLCLYAIYSVLHRMLFLSLSQEVRVAFSRSTLLEHPSYNCCILVFVLQGVLSAK